MFLNMKESGMFARDQGLGDLIKLQGIICNSARQDKTERLKK